MIAVVDDGKLQKRKASCILQNGVTNEHMGIPWAEEHNDLIQIIGVRETIPHVKSFIFEDMLKINLNFCLQLCWKLSLHWSRGGILRCQKQ